MAQLSASAPAPAHTSGRLQAAAQVRTTGRLQATDTARTSGRLQAPASLRNSGRLRTPEQESSSVERVPQGAYSEARANGNHRQRSTDQRKVRRGVRDVRRKESARRKIILIPLIVICLGVAAFLLAPVVKVLAPQVDAETSLSTLSTFRSQPSRQPGKTVDQCVNQWLDESRKTGDLVSYSGWSVRPIKFDTGKVLIGFSFVDKSGVQMAEWLADVHKNTFIPKNDLAVQVYGNE